MDYDRKYRQVNRSWVEEEEECFRYFANPTWKEQPVFWLFTSALENMFDDNGREVLEEKF